MEPIELRDQHEARRYVVEGLWLQRIVKPSAVSTRQALMWSMEVVSSGKLLPPVGFIADVGHMAFASELQHWSKEPIHIPGWPANFARQYEDHVLGKLQADWTFERAADALRRYQGNERLKGLGYLVNQLRERAGGPDDSDSEAGVVVGGPSPPRGHSLIAQRQPERRPQPRLGRSDA